jgi:hypothetical protein
MTQFFSEKLLEERLATLGQALPGFPGAVAELAVVEVVPAAAHADHPPASNAASAEAGNAI